MPNDLPDRCDIPLDRGQSRRLFAREWGDRDEDYDDGLLSLSGRDADEIYGSADAEEVGHV